MDKFERKGVLKLIISFLDRTVFSLKSLYWKEDNQKPKNVNVFESRMNRMSEF